MTIRINHNRSTALEQSVINHFGGLNLFYARATLALGSDAVHYKYNITNITYTNKIQQMNIIITTINKVSYIKWEEENSSHFSDIINEPCHEKTCLRGLQPG